MGLTRFKLGALLELSDERNSAREFGVEDVRGISTQKCLIKTKADMDGVSLVDYKLMRPRFFAYVPDTSRRGDMISLAFNSEEKTFLLSSISVVFRVKHNDILHPDYLFMYFNRPEFDRYSRYHSWGSARETFSWEDMCDIDIPLPPLSVQQKYVDVYNALIANQRSYERGLEDLKLTCEALADQFKCTAKTVPIGDLLQEVDVRNTEGLCRCAQGINISKQFMPSVASSADLKRYKLVNKRQFAYSSMQTGRDECIRIALSLAEEPIVVSPAYSVLECKSTSVIEEYLQLWFSREETDRRGWFMSDASIRANLDLRRFYEMEIPVPSLSEQKSLVGIYKALALRQSINERLKKRIRDMCPVLIRGALAEAETEQAS